MYPKSATSGRLNWNLGNPKMSNWVVSSSKNTTQCDCYDVYRIDASTAKAFVLACIDFRLRDSISCQLNNRGYKDNYDEVTSAGASLGYNGLLDYTNWNTYIDEHVQLAYDLHTINEIIIIDHEDCGAYKAQYGDASYNLKKHYDNIKLCVDTLWAKFNSETGTIIKIPKLKIIGYIISLNGCELKELYSSNKIINK